MLSSDNSHVAFVFKVCFTTPNECHLEDYSCVGHVCVICVACCYMLYVMYYCLFIYIVGLYY